MQVNTFPNTQAYQYSGISILRYIDTQACQYWGISTLSVSVALQSSPLWGFLLFNWKVPSPVLPLFYSGNGSHCFPEWELQFPRLFWIMTVISEINNTEASNKKWMERKWIHPCKIKIPLFLMLKGWICGYINLSCKSFIDTFRINFELTVSMLIPISIYHLSSNPTISLEALRYSGNPSSSEIL